MHQRYILHDSGSTWQVSYLPYTDFGLNCCTILMYALKLKVFFPILLVVLPTNSKQNSALLWWQNAHFALSRKFTLIPWRIVTFVPYIPQIFRRNALFLPEVLCHFYYISTYILYFHFSKNVKQMKCLAFSIIFHSIYLSYCINYLTQKLSNTIQ